MKDKLMNAVNNAKKAILPNKNFGQQLAKEAAICAVKTVVATVAFSVTAVAINTVVAHMSNNVEEE